MAAESFAKSNTPARPFNSENNLCSHGSLCVFGGVHNSWGMEIRCDQEFVRKLSDAGSLYTVRSSTVCHTTDGRRAPAALSGAGRWFCELGGRANRGDQ